VTDTGRIKWSDETSPRPWVVSEDRNPDYADILDNLGYAVTIGCIPRGNAALIVRAVNMHDELVAELKKLVVVLEAPGDGFCYEARTLLTRAKEGT
jgi:hypothetical protein